MVAWYSCARQPMSIRESFCSSSRRHAFKGPASQFVSANYACALAYEHTWQDIPKIRLALQGARRQNEVTSRGKLV